MENETRFAPMMVAEPNRDVFEQLVERIESDVDRDGWDQPNRLFRIDSHASPIAGMAALAVSEVPWPAHQSTTHPAEALAIDAAVVSVVPADDLRLDEFVGLALSVESWGVEAPAGDVDPELEEARRKRELHLRPDRYEIRLVMLVSPVGEVMAYRRRGGNAEVMDMADHTGTVPDALRGLFAAFVLRKVGAR